MISPVAVWRNCRMCRYFLNGGFSTAMHFLTMFLLMDWGVAAVLASACGAAIGAVVDYVVHYHLTFHSRKAHSGAMALYVVVVVIGWFLNTLFFFVFFTALALPAFWAQVLATGTLAFANYWFFKKRVFL